MDDALPDFPAGAGPVRPVLVLDVLGRTVLADEGRHREVLAALAAWERQIRARAAGAKPAKPGDVYEPEEAPKRRKAADTQPRLFVTKETKVLKIISGGQTGVDRAALDVALERHLPCGGWCPKDRLAEDGRIPDRYPLTECSTDHYPTRTRLNVEHADATLLLLSDPADMAGGTKLTHDIAARDTRRPFCFVRMDAAGLDEALGWLRSHAKPGWVLNVAGPRESKRPGIQGRTVTFLRLLLDRLDSGG
jgi:hypothetical protein